MISEETENVESSRKLETENPPPTEAPIQLQSANFEENEGDGLIIDEQGKSKALIFEPISQEEVDISEETTEMSGNLENSQIPTEVEDNHQTNDDPPAGLKDQISLESDLEESYSDDDKPITALIQPDTLVDPIDFISNTDEPPCSSTIDKNSNWQIPGSVIRKSGLMLYFSTVLKT